MAVDREKWSDQFYELPNWPCPTCGKGQLLPIDEKILVIETGPSTAAREHEAWEPDWISSRFAAFLKCNMAVCGDVASTSGTADSKFFEEINDYEHRQDLVNVYIVRSIDPAPIPIQVPEDTPDNVISAIKAAAATLWTSSEAAGNHIRQAIELFLDDIGIPSTGSSGTYITLHNRIKTFASSHSENGAVLLAIKWIGNSGSHPSGLGRGDVLDAFDMLEFILESQYGNTKADLLAKVAAINIKKGPLKET